MRAVLTIVTCLFLMPAPKSVTADEHGEETALFVPNELKWEEGPKALPPGAKLVVLEGDPSKDGPFVIRLRLPDGYTIPAHTHPKTERLTVISGAFHIAMGDKLDKRSGKKMPAGSFGYWAAGMKHLVWAEGDTVVQLHGVGPWSIKYVNPDDDPRNQK